MTGRRFVPISRKTFVRASTKSAPRAAKTQNTVSKIESADDVLVSSVVRYMHSIGGGVELVLKTPDGKATRVDFDPEISIKNSA